MAHLNTEKYEVVPIGISRTGQWMHGISPVAMLTEEQRQKAPVEDETSVGVVEVAQQERQLPRIPESILHSMEEKLDVIFPVLHGSYGEDGAIQGLLDMANIPYVGCGILGSALGMDKEKMKLIFHAVGLSTVDTLTFRRSHWECSPGSIINNIEQRIGYPCFVKPANGGSSIGITKVYHRDQLHQAIQLAAEYDSKVVVEQAIKCRELACSVLGNDDPVASAVGEVVVNADFYDYHTKYLDETSRTIVPAPISCALTEEVRRQAITAFLALDLCGLARVDFFLAEETGQLFINEVNTLPSFTQQCMYPRLCEVSGLTYPFLLDHLINLAIERYMGRQRNRVCA
jgi:D-alanine-D-alanine ligase